jgi:hypothetical protein
MSALSPEADIEQSGFCSTGMAVPTTKLPNSDGENGCPGWQKTPQSRHFQEAI